MKQSKKYNYLNSLSRISFIGMDLFLFGEISLLGVESEIFRT